MDRDDDIGRKVGVKGPIIGRELNLEVAQKFALVDPGDTDVNAIYMAVKTADEMKTEVVTLTGSEHVGLISDQEISRQLDEVLTKFKPESIIFVSDGMDDEQVIPIVQSRIKIDAVQRIVVRQSRELEKAYFKFASFMREVSSDPTIARLIFGLPGLILLLLGLGGMQALSLILAVIGLYLIIKGFGLEEQFFSGMSAFLKSLSVDRISTILYFLAFITFFLGVSYAWGDIQKGIFKFTDSNTTLTTAGLFILNSSSINIILLSVMIVVLGRMIDDWHFKRIPQVRRYMILAAFIVFVKIVLDAGANYMVNEDYGFERFMLNALVGVVSLAIWTRMTDYFFLHEMSIIKKVIKETEGKEVNDTSGTKLGKVSKVVVENLKLKEITAGGRSFPLKEIVSIGEEIVVKKQEEDESAAVKVSKVVKQFKLQTPMFPNFSDTFIHSKHKKKQQRPDS